MKRSNRLIILIGFFLAIVAFTGVVLMGTAASNKPSAKASPSPTAEPNTTIVVAKSQISLGMKITAEMLDEQSISVSKKAELGDGYFTLKGEVIGKTAGATIEAGSYIQAGEDFTPAGTVKEGVSLKESVGKGMVGVTIEVDQVNGVGTLIVPQDHVDVILSVWTEEMAWKGIQYKTGNGKDRQIDIDGGKDVTTKLIIQNRKVIATLLPAPEPTEAPAGSPNPSATPAPSQPDTVSMTGRHMVVMLEVTPDEAEIIRWAQRAEKADTQNYITLGLALRSSQDDNAANVKTPGITMRQLVTLYSVLPPDARAAIPPDILSKITW